MDKDTCCQCGAEGWVNSLGYCKGCMDEHIRQHHEEVQLQLIEVGALEATYGYNARV